MSSSGCAQTNSSVPSRSMLIAPPGSSRGEDRVGAGVCRTAPGRASEALRGGMDVEARGLAARHELIDPLLQALRQLAFGTLGPHEVLQMLLERRSVGTRPASREVPFDLRTEIGVQFVIEESLDLTERLFALGPAVNHRQVPVPWLFPTTPARALSFPGGAGSSRCRSDCP